MNTLFNVTNLPRKFEGALSAMYIGTVVEANPVKNKNNFVRILLCGPLIMSAVFYFRYNYVNV